MGRPRVSERIITVWAGEFTDISVRSSEGIGGSLRFSVLVGELGLSTKIDRIVRQGRSYRLTNGKQSTSAKSFDS